MVTPPFGMCLFVMKGVVPADTTMGEIYRASAPFLIVQLFIMLIMIVFPPVVLWLTKIM
jgi:TRAP-type mannitol/chloroaromatic compound transport system permease large subunit